MPIQHEDAFKEYAFKKGIKTYAQYASALNKLQDAGITINESSLANEEDIQRILQQIKNRHDIPQNRPYPGWLRKYCEFINERAKNEIEVRSAGRIVSKNPYKSINDLKKMELVVKQFYIDADNFTHLANESIHSSYRAFLAFFSEKKEITKADFIIGANFVYGWMPTILDLHGDLTHAVELANKVKLGYDINDNELKVISTCTNNSLVGASKLLHVINPEKHAIWDSRVYRYIYQKNANGKISSIHHYRAYIELLNKISNQPQFINTKERIDKIVNYKISSLRAIEMVMFECGKKDSTRLIEITGKS